MTQIETSGHIKDHIEVLTSALTEAGLISSVELDSLLPGRLAPLYDFGLSQIIAKQTHVLFPSSLSNE